MSIQFQVMYGGRVIDDFDRRIVKNYMDEYMGDFLFDVFQPFHFYVDETVDYKIPEEAFSRDDFIGIKNPFFFIKIIIKFFAMFSCY